MLSVFSRFRRVFHHSFVAPAEPAPVLPHRTAWQLGSTDRTSLHRKLFYVLSAAALAYAFFAGLRTIKDYDLGWQLATGRWVVQHHHAPPVEAFSYIATGNWIYPVGAGLLFYAAYLLGGFALLSWMGAAASCGTVALLLRRGSVLTAAIAVLAVPMIAWRTAPRADMFTVVLFAAFLSLLWENYRTGNARLWLLPVLMVAWVNLHLGFASGLALIAWYIGAEVLESLFGANRRQAAMERLRRAYPWLIATFVATVVNPWGWNILRALIRQQRALPGHQQWFAEWQSVPVNWNVVTAALPQLRDPSGTIYLLLLIAVVAGGIALLAGRPGAGILLLGAAVPAVRYVRMDAVFACVVVVAGGSVLAETLPYLSPKRRTTTPILAATVSLLLLGLVVVRCFDLVTNRYYLGTVEESTFGAGLGWWFPQRAADFIERQKLPGELFNIYTEGGYVSWRLAPARRDYMDGRGIPFGLDKIEHEIELRQSPPDSALWQDEVSRYNINTVLLPIARYQGVQFVRLKDFCESKNWQLVYMDEVSAVFVRRTPQNAELIQRFPLSCTTVSLPPALPTGSSAAAFNAWANSAAVLESVGRNQEALAATDKGLAILPDSAFLHWLRGNLLSADGRFDDAEHEYRAAIDASPSDSTWGSLAEFYRKRGRTAEAIDAEQHAARYSASPWLRWMNVGNLYLQNGQAEDAVAAFDKAARSAVWDMKAADNGIFDYRLALARSNAWRALGEQEKATYYQQEAARLRPHQP